MNSELPFSKVKVEQRGTGSNKRRDISLLDKSQRVVLTGEVKLPYRKDGGSPFNTEVLNDAQSKARRAKSPFFFTWNVNTLVLWETTPAKVSWRQQNYRLWEVVQVYRENQLEHPTTIHAIQDWLPKFLHEFSHILLGRTALGTKLPDEKFIEALESSLRVPILQNMEKLAEHYKKPKLKIEIDGWMREEQGWIIYDNPDGISENLERASKFACYALVNKLVFHETLLKRYGTRMGKLAIPEHIGAGDELRKHLERYFAEARDVTGDYETVFGEDHNSIGSRIPFYSDQAVPHWIDLINQIHRFDFSKLDYDVIGTIFERLISPEERHKYGQFYTKVEIVDLMNSFCIRHGNERLMDPACGGGTFLVRAYARKRELMPQRKHSELLNDLYGVDISHFATHLTTINLATRDLIDEENYPQIVRNDFFDVESGRTFITLPRQSKVKGLGKSQHREVKMASLDAVVGNPPYIRQEDIPRSKTGKGTGSQHGTKEYYANLVKAESGALLSGRSDIHCYFWPHAASFLKDGGYLCLLTSSQWLDVEYGFRLQEWILRNFEIVAVFESVDEPWFVGARVVTTATILKRQKDDAKRMEQIVRFVQLRRPIRELLAHDGTTAGAVRAADMLRNEIELLSANVSNERYRARLVRQGDLWEEGVHLGRVIDGGGDNQGSVEEAQNGDYFGGKWGVHLRAPDLWFKLIDEYGDKLVPLGEIATIKYGVKTGMDDYFFPIDKSSECLQRYTESGEFEKSYGVPRKVVASGKVKLVACGAGREEIRPIEARYLEPEVHSLMEVSNYSVADADCSRLVFLAPSEARLLAGTYAEKYISWGESLGIHKLATCAARVTANQKWYDLTHHQRAPVLWPKERQYREIAPTNPKKLIANCRLYEIYPPTEMNEPELWGGLLNSTLTLFSLLQYGRPVGNEGNWSTMVSDVHMMLVPNPRLATPELRRAVKNSFLAMSSRQASGFLSERRLRSMAFARTDKLEQLENLSAISELDMPDRRDLDHAILEMMGIKSKKDRQSLIIELYDYLREYFETVRQKEEKAIENKKSSKKHNPAKASDIAIQVYQEIEEAYPFLLRRYDPDFLDRSKPFDTYEFPTDGHAEIHSDMFSSHGIRFANGKKTVSLVPTRGRFQDDLIVIVANSGVRGLVRVPLTAGECHRLFLEFSRFVQERDRIATDLVESRTSDDKMQAEVREYLNRMLSSA